MSERRKGERNFLGSAESPYSKGLMARALTAVGLREDEAYELARRTESDLGAARRGRPSTSTGCGSSRATTSAQSAARARSASSAASATCRSSTCR